MYVCMCVCMSVCVYVCVCVCDCQKQTNRAQRGTRKCQENIDQINQISLRKGTVRSNISETF